MSQGDGRFAQQVRQLVPLLQAEGGVVQHSPVEVARLLDLQLVDSAAELHELTGQLLVLDAHVHLQKDSEDIQSWMSTCCSL